MILATNGIVYVGGTFSYVAPKGSKLVSIDPFTGALEQGFPAIYGTSIYSIVEDGNGGWFVGGDFSLVGNSPRTNLVHILNNNTVDSAFQPNPNGAVRALALNGGTLYIGGEFSTMAAKPRSQLAAWDTSAQLLLPWAPQANATVSSLLAAGTTLYVGGYFTQISAEPRKNIASVDGLSGAVLPWNPQGDGAVLTMDLQDQTLYVGGFFNRVGGQLRNGLAALDIKSTNALSWDPNPVGGKINSLKVDCNTVYVGGYFTNIGGANRYRIAAVDSNTGQATSWNASLDLYYSASLASYVSTLTIVGDRVYLGGEFSSIGGQSQHDVAAVSTSTGQLVPWNPGINGGVSAVAAAGRRVLAGIVTATGGVARRNLAAFNETNGVVLSFAPLVSGPVYAMAIADSKLFVGGDFTSINGFSRTRLAALDAISGSVLTNWSASANNAVYALANDDTNLYAGGSFTTVNSATRQRLAAINLSDGQNLSTWAAHADGTVYALELLGANLYAGGSFVSVSGFTRHRLAALSRLTGSVQPWNPDANQAIYALRTDGLFMYAGGSFTSINGTPRARLAAINPASGILAGWNPGTDDEVRAITLSGNYIFIGGIFLHVGGIERLGCAGLLSDGSILEWNPGLSQGNRVYASAFSPNGLYLGGGLPLEFRTGFGGHALAAFPPEGFPVIIQGPLDAESKVGKPFNFSVQASGETPLAYFWTLNGTTVISNNLDSLSAIAQAGGSAIYQVTVSNRLGIASARASLTVLEPVTISSQPLSQNVSIGDTVTLAVQATGSPLPTYQWRVNGLNIPGAVFPTLTLSNVSPASGGSFYAVVGNRMGAINSDVAVLTIADAALPFADTLASRGSIAGFSGSGIGNNSAATRESNEPSHAQKMGGKSLWLSWTAPANGVATITTRGSTFDTLLAVYTGSSITNLALVASDEDRGGNLTGQVDFNAGAGVEYLIAVDGLAGASGPLVLNWSLDSTPTPFPQITSQPISQSVAAGGMATFAVQASGPPPLTYQWFFGCRQIQDATNSSLTISNVGLYQVGAYRVFIMNGSTKFAESLPASLQLSSFPGILSFDKIEDLLSNGTAGTNGFSPSKQSGFAGGSQPLLVSMGTIISQTFDTSSGSSFIKETNHCGVIGGASAWIRFQPAQDGTVLVDTIGSLFDTVLAIYRDTNLTVLATNPSAALVDCDNNGAPDNIRSQLKFKTKAGEVYLAVVDGVLSAKGIANIDWQLGSKPTIITSAPNVTGTFGKAVTLFSGTSSTTLRTAYQWLFNGVPIPGATNSTLVLTNLMPINAGTYTVSVSNFAGSIVNDAAHLAIDVPLHLDPVVRMIGGQLQAAVWGNPAQLFVLQGSTDLQTWVSLSTNTIQTNPTTVSDPGSAQFRNRFYRVRLYP
jgi:hypothetical protein